MRRYVGKKGFVFCMMLVCVGATLLPCVSGWSGEPPQMPLMSTNKDSYHSSTIFDLPPEEEWNRTFGGDHEDVGYSVSQTTDGGYIIAGVNEKWINLTQWSFFGDGWLIKTDASGSIQWERKYGASGTDIFYSVDQTSDGGYIVSGVKSIAYEYCEGLWLLKTDSSGTMQWNKVFQSGGDDLCVGYSVSQTTDGGFIIAGLADVTTAKPYEWGSLWLIKTDAAGNEQWSKKFGHLEDGDIGRCVDQTTDGGYIVTGGTNSYGSGGAWLIKTNEDGTEQWNRTFGGTLGYSVSQTTDGGYIIASDTLMKTDGVGVLQWSRAIPGVCAQQTGDGGYVIVDAGGLVRTDSDGIIQWEKPFGDSSWGCWVQQTNDDGYIVTGWTGPDESSADVWLMKMGSGDELVSAVVFGKIANLSYEAEYIKFDAVKTLVVTFSPLSVTVYSSGESCVVSKDGFVGRIINATSAVYIIAFCKLLR